MDSKNALAVFQGKNIRRTWHEDEWWFVVEDVIAALTDSRDPKQYIQKMKQPDPILAKGWVRIVHTLKVVTTGGSQNMITNDNYLDSPEKETRKKLFKR